MRPFVVCAIAILCASCLGHGQDAHEPGDALGTFHVSGALSADTCQAAVLGVTPNWEFDVKLSRQGDTIYWLNGQEAIPGAIESDGKTFSFASGVEVPIEAGKGSLPGCTVLRSDAANGVLSSKSDDVKSFSVQMTFGYSVKSGSQCADVVGVEGGFTALPCNVGYGLNASRTVAPARPE